MKCTVSGDIITFSTGKRISANHGIFGICADLIVSEGYDGGITNGHDGELLPIECDELSDMMIARWMAFKTKSGAAKDHENTHHQR